MQCPYIYTSGALCSTYVFSADRAGELELVHSDIAVLGQQLLLLLLVRLLGELNIKLIDPGAANLHVCNVSTKAMLVEEVKTFCFGDLI